VFSAVELTFKRVDFMNPQFFPELVPSKIYLRGNSKPPASFWFA